MLPLNERTFYNLCNDPFAVDGQGGPGPLTDGDAAAWNGTPVRVAATILDPARHTREAAVLAESSPAAFRETPQRQSPSGVQPCCGTPHLTVGGRRRQ